MNDDTPHLFFFCFFFAHLQIPLEIRKESDYGHGLDTLSTYSR